MNQVRPVAAALLKLGVFGAGAYLSVLSSLSIFEPKRSYFFFFVGMIFGAVVLVWRNRSLRESTNLRAFSFLASSTLIWILVYMGTEGTHLINPAPTPSTPAVVIPSTFRDVLFRDANGPIILGTILLTLAHSWLLRTPWRRALVAIPCIFGIWILGYWNLYRYVLATAHSTSELQFAQISATLVSIPIWQGAYLLCMLGSIPQSLKARFPSPS